MTILTTDRPVETELPVDYAAGFRSGLLAAYRELRDGPGLTTLGDYPDRTTYQQALDQLEDILREHGVPTPPATADTGQAEDLWADDVDATPADEASR